MTDLDATRSFYGRWARVYDVVASLPGVRSWREAAVEELQLGATDTAVEMGCGTGANLPLLRRRVGPDGRVIGVDVTRRALQIARKRGGPPELGRTAAASCGRGEADLLQADATRPPLVGPGDGLLATFVVGMFDDPAAAVDEWCDLVGPGGRIALLHFSRSDRWWAGPLNLGYRAFVYLSAPDSGVPGDGGSSTSDAAGADDGGVAGDGGTSPIDLVAHHDARVRLAHDALAERTTDYREHHLAGGFLRLASGTVPNR